MSYSAHKALHGAGSAYSKLRSAVKGEVQHENFLLINAKKQPISEEVVKSIEKAYSCTLPGELKHIVSCDDNNRFGYDIKDIVRKKKY